MDSFVERQSFLLCIVLSKLYVFVHEVLFMHVSYYYGWIYRCHENEVYTRVGIDP